MPRLLFIVNHPRWFMTHRLAVAEAADARGYEVHVATPPGESVDVIASRFTWHRVRLHRSGISPVRELVAFLDIVRLVRRLRPDLIHNVTLKPVLHGTTAARLCKVPAVVNAVAGVGHVFSSRRMADAVLQRIGAAFFRFVLRHRRMRVVFQNQEDCELFVGNRWIRAEDAVLIPGSGVDTDRFRPAAAAHDVVTVLFASRLLYTKGIVEFVTAARMLRPRFPTVRFLIAGDFDDANRAAVDPAVLDEWVKNGEIEYCGFSERLEELLEVSDIFCLPTKYGEGVPRVLLEAAASGLPIVTTDSPGCRWVVRDGENGFLVPAGDPSAVADALERLLTDSRLRRAMGARSRERALRDFQAAEVVRKTLSVYDELGR